MISARKVGILCLAAIFSFGLMFPPAGMGITVKEEEEMSREFMKLVSKEFEFIEEPAINAYVTEVGRKIVKVLPPQPFTYHFHIVHEDVYNAFATPAGHIFINSGLLEAMDSEEELAGILAHEIAHVQLRHISQKIERSKKISIATLAGIAAGIFLGAAGGGQAAQALTIGSLAAGQSAGLAYSREDERQADQIGLDYLAKAGYGAEGLVKALSKIRDKQWFGPKEIPTYLTTHPAVDERIAYISTWIAEHGEPEQAAERDPGEFERIHTRLIIEYGDAQAVSRKLEGELKERPEDPMAHYHYGLILARTGNKVEAVRQLQIALEKRAFDPYILRDLGSVYFLSGRYSKALNALKGAMTIAPEDPETLFYYGRTRMELGDTREAVLIFEDLVRKYPGYAQARYFLGTAYGREGKIADANYHLGVYHYKRGEFRIAVVQLERALAATTDSDRSLEIKDMLKDIGRDAEKKPQDPQQKSGSHFRLMPGGFRSMK